VVARDTSSEARVVQREAQRRLGGAARLELAFEMSEEARRISIAGLLSRHPGLSGAEARARVLRRILGPALYAAAYERRSG
jgi:hypothetical protein